MRICCTKANIFDKKNKSKKHHTIHIRSASNQLCLSVLKDMKKISHINRVKKLKMNSACCLCFCRLLLFLFAGIFLCYSGWLSGHKCSKMPLFLHFLLSSFYSFSFFRLKSLRSSLASGSGVDFFIFVFRLWFLFQNITHNSKQSNNVTKNTCSHMGYGYEFMRSFTKMPRYGVYEQKLVLLFVRYYGTFVFIMIIIVCALLCSARFGSVAHNP